MTIFDIHGTQDRTQELGLDLFGPEVEAAVAANSQREVYRSKVLAGRRRKEQLKTNVIVALFASIIVTVVYAMAQPSVSDQVQKGINASSVNPATTTTVVASGKG